MTIAVIIGVCLVLQVDGVYENVILMAVLFE